MVLGSEAVSTQSPLMRKGLEEDGGSGGGSCCWKEITLEEELLLAWASERGESSVG